MAHTFSFSFDDDDIENGGTEKTNLYIEPTKPQEESRMYVRPELHTLENLV